MIQVKFKNLAKSEIVHDTVMNRIETLVHKFEDLEPSRLTVTLEMHNSPTQPGPDLFTVKLHIAGGRFRGTTVSKSDLNLYRALAELVDHMLEKLNRTGDKQRVKNRNRARQLARLALERKSS